MWSPSQVAERRVAKRKPLFHSHLNLWPFVGVLLVLLMMFMMGVMPIYPRSVGVDLPSAFHATAQPKAMAEDAMRVL